MAREQTWIRRASGARSWLKERQKSGTSYTTAGGPTRSWHTVCGSSAGMLNMQARQPVPTTLDGTRIPKAGRGAYSRSGRQA